MVVLRRLMIAVLVVWSVVPLQTLAFPLRAPEIQEIDFVSGQVVDSWLPFSSTTQGGVTIATENLNGTAPLKTVVAQSGGPEATGQIRLFASDHEPLADTAVRGQGLSHPELSVATGDVDGDGRMEVVVGIPSYTDTVVVILNERLEIDHDTIGMFHAFPGVNAGVTVAVAQVTGDATEEIVVGTGAGVAPQLGVFSAQGRPVLPSVMPFSDTDQYGLSIATARTLPTGNFEDIVVGFANGGQTWVKVYDVTDDGSYPVRSEFLVWSREFYSGVSLTGGDVDGDGTEEILVAPAGDQQTEVRVYRGDGTRVDRDPLFIYEDDFRGGVSIDTIQPRSSTGREPLTLVVAPSWQRQRGDIARAYQYIEVDLSEQWVRLWEGAYLRNVYLVSTGLPGTPTPEGEFSITKKIERHTYDGRPVYFFPNTPWNLRFHSLGEGRSFYFHTAYWHNNFGRPQSHGCVNMREPDAKFLYFWAEIDTPVTIHQ